LERPSKLRSAPTFNPLKPFDIVSHIAFIMCVGGIP
jgi:hypothetical protein